MTPERWIEYLKHSIESHDRRIAELVENGARVDSRIAANSAQIAAQSANIDKLVSVTNLDAEHIRTLARVAELHEKRLDRIEGA